MKNEQEELQCVSLIGRARACARRPRPRTPRPSPTSRCTSSCPSRRAARPTWSRARWRKSCRPSSASRSSSRTSRAPAAPSPPRQVAKAAPDGYTLLVNSSGHTVNPCDLSQPPLRHGQGPDGHQPARRASPTSWWCRRDKGWKTVDDLVKAGQGRSPARSHLRLGRRRQRHPHERREVQGRRRHRRPCTSPTRARPRR